MSLTGCNSSTPPSEGSTAAAPCDSHSSTCPNECASRVFPAREVNQAVSETISNAPSTPTDYTRWNGTYGWRSKFTLVASRNPCSITVTVKIKVTGTITTAQKNAWKSAIEGKWNGKAKLVCPDPTCAAACPSGYPISVVVQYVTSGEHQAVAANTPGSGGTEGLGGTNSMNGWGVNDTVDVTHEFGHMLGSPEEYFTTNGVDYTHGGTTRGFRDSGAGIMNNPAGDPLPRNYDLIRREAAAAMGVSCTVQAA